MSSLTPFVAVWMVTYNHERFLAQAIESVIQQQTTFPIKLFIGDDCSTDKTREICLLYKQRYPHVIELCLNEKNRGALANSIQIYHACFQSGAKYFAMLEGDDYWTSPIKLQRQVESLERHPDWTICGHWTDILYQDSGKIEAKKYGLPLLKPVYTIDDVLAYGAFVATSSIMFRNGLFTQLPAWFQQVTQGDFVMLLLHAQHGNLGFLDDTMAVYRIHRGGVCGGVTEGIVLEKNVQEYLRIGKHLQLKQRPSYRMGLYKQSCGLLYRYLAEHVYRDAWRLLPLVFMYAPSLRLKVQIVLDVLQAWFLTYYRCIRIRTLNMLKYYSGENGYHQLKWLYHVMENFYNRIFTKVKHLFKIERN